MLRHAFSYLTVSCADWKRKGYTSSGYYTIDPDGRNTGVEPFRVYCDMTTDASTGKVLGVKGNKKFGAI